VPISAIQGVPLHPELRIFQDLQQDEELAMDEYQGPAEKLAKIGFKAATGTDDLELQQELVTQVTMALPRSTSLREENRQAAAAIAALAAFKPQDALEGMLATQMVLVHHAAVECMVQAMARATPEAQELCFRQSVRLMAMFQRQVEGLNRHRGREAPMVNVEAVNVQAGGQAVVGAVDARGSRRPRGSRGCSAAQALDHRPVTMLAVQPPAAATDGDARLKRLPPEDLPVERRPRRG
jgi:hypothetical protein